MWERERERERERENNPRHYYGKGKEKVEIVVLEMAEAGGGVINSLLLLLRTTNTLTYPGVSMRHKRWVPLAIIVAACALTVIPRSLSTERRSSSCSDTREIFPKRSRRADASVDLPCFKIQKKTNVIIRIYDEVGVPSFSATRQMNVRKQQLLNVYLYL